jgi:hypothetical protein
MQPRNWPMVRRVIGNSVCPPVAEALVRANLGRDCPDPAHAQNAQGGS